LSKREEIINLIPKRKKNIWHLIFSRLLIFVILIILQINVFLMIYNWFSEYIPNFKIIQGVFTVTMILYLFNCSMDSSAKLTWLFIIMLFPLPGTVLLWFTQAEIGHRAVTDRVHNIIGETMEMIPQDKEVISNLELIDSGTDDLCRYINRSGCYPIFSNTDVKYFPLGEYKFSAMIDELEKAEKFIFMEYFIIGEGYMWGKILDIIARKAKLGVEVRVMYDGMCEISTLTFDYPERLAVLGIKCKAFSPIKPFLSTHYNYRDHRKILVIDNKTAFNGGINLADEYINKEERFGHWKDTAVMVKGDAVKSYTLMFLQMWNITEKVPEWEKWIDFPTESIKSKGFVMPYADCPLDGEKVGKNVYTDVLYRAKHYVHIMTPYLILDGELETAIKYAAERGIDVKIILPGIPDKKMAYALAKSHYRTLIKAGVKIYEYTPGFVHAKVFTSDDCKAIVGTINLDYRSLYHHFECATYMYQTDCISDIERDFKNTLKECRKVSLETIRTEKLYYKIVGGIMKLIAPLM